MVLPGLIPRPALPGQFRYSSAFEDWSRHYWYSTTVLFCDNEPERSRPDWLEWMGMV
jgi:hypothetical protein